MDQFRDEFLAGEFLADESEPGNSFIPQARDCWRCGKQVDLRTASCPYCTAEFEPAIHARSPSGRSNSEIIGTDLGKMLLVYGGMLLATIIVVVPFAMRGLFGDASGATLTEILTPIITVEFLDTIMVLAALAWINVAKDDRKPDRPCQAASWIFAVPVLALLLAFNVAYHAMLRQTLGIPIVENPLFGGQGLLPITLIVVCVQPALIEEIFFRHMAFCVMRPVLGLHTTVFVTAIMFGLAHIAVPLSIPMLVVLGLALGYARAASGGMLLPILLHFLHNLAVVGLEAKWFDVL